MKWLRYLFASSSSSLLPPKDKVWKEKPWGGEELWAHTKKYVGKILVINEGKRLSLQFHKKKTETIYLLSGEMQLQIGTGEEAFFYNLKPGDVYHIEPWTTHRMIAVSDCRVLEVSTPELDDVVRLEDDYGRTKL